ncbi:hypothetical protein [Geomonas sp.]|uniref:hypothetical protein n=1 Tax=Geomonas sp. TaxID=2651584 RepID=UPI002B49B413|nr:hypothetical protein [Geomonas sp.]HJV37081.1 hypothetical protein [Geomonas sp.]
MQQQERIAKLINWFVKAAVRHAEAIEAMDEEGAMVQVHELDRFYAAIKRERGVELFLTLLESDDAAVAGMAAVYAMRQAPNRCAYTLAKIAKLPGLMGFRAQVALERWESGEWPNE